MKLITPEYLLGRRFQMLPVGNAAITRTLPEFTIVSVDQDADRVRVHRTDGYAQVLGFQAVVNGVYEGVLVESERGVPFTLERPKELR
jgi:hypothetical protein